MMRKLLLLILCLCLAAPALAADESEDGGKATSGLPLPRFASLRTGEVNLRTGPGTRYPIEWVYIHQGVPVEITAEYEIWRRIRDVDGTEGWVHKVSLTGKRTVMVIGTLHDLHKDPESDAPVLAHLEAGAMGQLLSCTKQWCRLKFNDIKGYLPKTDFWGAYPNEVLE